MPFEVCNGPAMFQRLMQQTLRGLRECDSIYIDDMVFSGTVKEHVRHLRLVFDLLQDIYLKLYPAEQSVTLHHVCTWYSPGSSFSLDW